MRSLLSGFLLLLTACGGETAGSVENACRNVLRVPGPEDLAVDRSATPPRLFVSSRNLRAGEPRPPGGIYSVTVQEEGEVTRLLPLVGRDDCSFQPHGISLTDAQEPGNPRALLLYVINHHEAEDSSPARGCFGEPADAPLRERPVTSVEVFRVKSKPDRLIFLQRIAVPEVLTNGNDLVALPNGEFWITNPPAGNLAQLRDIRLGDSMASKVLHFACPKDGNALPVPPCSWKWNEAVKLGGYANGIAYSPEELGRSTKVVRPARLYVASTGGKSIHVYDIGEERKLTEVEPLPLCNEDSSDCSHPDNLEWEDDDHLLVAAHSDLRRFLQHVSSAQVPAPSEVWRMPVEGSEKPRRLFREEGKLVSAVSTGACVEGNLFLGQVFGRGVWRCAKPKVCSGKSTVAAARSAP